MSAFSPPPTPVVLPPFIVQSGSVAWCIAFLGNHLLWCLGGGALLIKARPLAEDNSEGLSWLKSSPGARWVLCNSPPFPLPVSLCPLSGDVPDLISDLSSCWSHLSLWFLGAQAQHGAAWKVGWDRPGFKSWLDLLVAMWFWASYLTCQNFIFHLGRKDFSKDCLSLYKVCKYLDHYTF